MAQVKCIVTAHALNRKTKKVISEPRAEKIYLGNPLFTHASTAEEVTEAYESFWNDLNPTSKEIVKVLSVEYAF